VGTVVLWRRQRRPPAPRSLPVHAGRRDLRVRRYSPGFATKVSGVPARTQRPSVDAQVHVVLVARFVTVIPVTNQSASPAPTTSRSFTARIMPTGVSSAPSPP